MPKFEILLKPSVEKDLRKLSSTVVRHVFAAIEQLADSPCYPPDKKLTGTERTCDTEQVIIASSTNLILPAQQ